MFVNVVNLILLTLKRKAGVVMKKLMITICLVLVVGLVFVSGCERIIPYEKPKTAIQKLLEEAEIAARVGLVSYTEMEIARASITAERAGYDMDEFNLEAEMLRIKARKVSKDKEKGQTLKDEADVYLRIAMDNAIEGYVNCLKWIKNHEEFCLENKIEPNKDLIEKIKEVYEVYEKNKKVPEPAKEPEAKEPETKELECKYPKTEISIGYFPKKFLTVEYHEFSFRYTNSLRNLPIEKESSNAVIAVIAVRRLYDFSKKYEGVTGLENIQNPGFDSVWDLIKKEIQVLVPDDGCYQAEIDVEFVFSGEEPYEFTISKAIVPSDSLHVKFYDGGSNALDGFVDEVNTYEFTTPNDFDLITTLREDIQDPNEKLFQEADDYATQAKQALINIDKIMVENFPEYKENKKHYIPE